MPSNETYISDRKSTDISLGDLKTDTSKAANCSYQSPHFTEMGIFRETAAATSACFCMFVTGCWIAWPSPALNKLLNGGARLQLTHAEASWTVALLDVGNMISPIPAGFLADRIGRKNLLLFTGPLYLVSFLLTLPTGSHYYLYLGRFLSGIGKGITFTVCPMYLGEIASNKFRGAISTIATGFLWGGSLFMFVVGPLVSYDALNIICAVFPVLFFLSFLWMPESPYGLLMLDKQENAENSLEWLRSGSDVKTQQELAEMKDIVDEEMKTKGSFKDLVLVPSNRRAAIIVLVSSAFQRLCGISSVLSYSSTTLPPSSGISFLGTNEVIMIFGALLTIANFLATPLVDSLGRKPLLMISSLGIAIVMSFSGFYYLFEPAQLAWIPYISLLLFGIFHSVGLGVIPSTLLSELFPSNVKSRASAVSAIVFAIASFITNKMYMPVQQQLGVQYMYFFFCVNAIIAFFFTTFVIFETKGKSFAEIQQRLKRT